MTRTEERLADALQASAGRVSDDRLRPLLDQERRASRGVRNWLVPAGAAAAVVLAVVLALAVAGGRPAGVRPSAAGRDQRQANDERDRRRRGERHQPAAPGAARP